MGFGELGGEGNNFEEDKIWKENGETRRKECGGNQVPAIREEEENENDFGAAISSDFGNGWDKSTLPEQQETFTDENALWNVELGWGEAIIIDDFEEVVADGRLELRGETSSNGKKERNE